MGLSRTIFEINGNICKSSPSCTLNAPAYRGSPWNFFTAVGLRKLEWEHAPIRPQKSDDMCIRLGTVLALDGQTRVGHGSLFQNPTQNFWTQLNPTHHRHLVWHIKLYRKLYKTTVTVTRHRQVHSSQLE